MVGPKPDIFQTQIAAALFTSIGVTLLRSGGTRPDERVLAVTSALTCAAVDLRHIRRLRKIFILDAALNVAFAVTA